MQERKPEKSKSEDVPSQETGIVFGDVKVEIFGKSFFPNSRGGSLQGLNSEEAFQEADKQPVLEFLDKEGDKNGIKIFKAPIAWPRHNGKLKMDNDWSEKYTFGNGKKMWKGENFEGCEISKGEAFIMSPADCMTVIIRVGDRTFVMHAGRESLFDASDPTRPTIVQNILNSFHGVDPTEIKIWAGFGIAPGEHFKHDENHPLHGEKNKLRKKLLKEYDRDETPNYVKDEHGGEHLDIQNIFENMCRAGGIKDLQIDRTFFTFSGEDVENRKYFTNSGGDIDGRNLVVVYLE